MIELCKETEQTVHKTLYDIGKETKRAMTLHETMPTLHHAKAVIEEEFDEFWLEVKKNPNKMTPEAREQWKKDLYKELVHTAAMCVRTIVDLKL